MTNSSDEFNGKKFGKTVPEALRSEPISMEFISPERAPTRDDIRKLGLSQVTAIMETEGIRDYISSTHNIDLVLLPAVMKDGSIQFKIGLHHVIADVLTKFVMQYHELGPMPSEEDMERPMLDITAQWHSIDDVLTRIQFIQTELDSIASKI